MILFRYSREQLMFWMQGQVTAFVAVAKPSTVSGAQRNALRRHPGPEFPQ